MQCRIFMQENRLSLTAIYCVQLGGIPAKHREFVALKNILLP